MLKWSRDAWGERKTEERGKEHFFSLCVMKTISSNELSPGCMFVYACVRLLTQELSLGLGFFTTHCHPLTYSWAQRFQSTILSPWRDCIRYTGVQWWPWGPRPPSIQSRLRSQIHSEDPWICTAQNGDHDRQLHWKGCGGVGSWSAAVWCHLVHYFITPK